MSSIGEHTEASSGEAEFGRVRDDERHSLSEVVVASADIGTRPVPARASVMAAAEALLEYASVGGLIATANRLSGAHPLKLRQSNWATAVGYNTKYCVTDSVSGNQRMRVKFNPAMSQFQGN